MQTSADKRLIGIVIPIYNESRAIIQNIKSIIAVLDAPKISQKYDFRLILVDDGSNDGTAKIIRSHFNQDNRIEIISFVRNFGKESAILAGLKGCQNTHAVIVMDSDLQHPPTMIMEMLELWSKGYKVVNAVKTDRDYLGRTGRLWGNSFYMLFKMMSGYDLANHTDFKLLDAVVVQAYSDLPEGRRFFRGLVMWLGYPAADLKFSVPERSGGGGSNWSQIRLFRYAVTSLTDFSAAPLYLISWFGAAVFLLGLVLAFTSLVQKLQGTSVTGFTTVIVLIFLTTGPIMVSLGLIGHYLGELFIEMKRRPVYLIKNETDDEGLANKDHHE